MLGQLQARAVQFSADVRPYVSGERPELLNTAPAVGDRFEGVRRQWPLAAVVEINFVLKCWT